MILYTCQEDKRKRLATPFKGSVGVSRKDVVHMVEYIFDVIYLVILYKIVKEIK